MKNKLHLISLLATIVTMLIGIPVLTGWFTKNDHLTQYFSFPGYVPSRL